MNNNYSYEGEELELFSAAHNWNNYLQSLLLNRVQGRVLEVGAGIGTKTKLLFNSKVTSWVCIEPDATMASLLEKMGLSDIFEKKCSVRVGTINEINTNEKFDTILYIDVIEHLDHDELELNKAIDLLNKDGLLMVVVPAHNFLFSYFDKALGHKRRYNKSMINSLVLHDVSQLQLLYLDTFGLIGSLLNKLFRQKMPNAKQVWMWDKLLVPLSRYFDRWLNFSVGKSVLAVWRKNN